MTYLRKKQWNSCIVAVEDFICQAAIYGLRMIGFDINVVQGDV